MKRLGGASSLCVFVLVLACAAACSRDPERAKREYLKSGDRYFDQKKYSEAIVQYRNALQHDPRFGEARFKLAQSYTRAGDPRAAAREYVRAADLLPGNVQAQVEAASALLLGGQFEDARARAQRALDRDPRNIEAHILLGNALAGLKDFAAAVKQLEDAIAIEPSPGAYAALGSVQSLKGDKPEAEAAFRKAVEVAPKTSNVHLALANYLWSAGRVPEAEQELKTVVELEPGNGTAHRALALLYLVSRRPREAEPHLRKLAELETSPQAPARLALADFLVLTNKPDDAIRILDDVATRAEGYAPARARVAALEYDRGLHAQGHRSIDEVLEKQPKFVLAQLVKARFLGIEHKYAEALAHAAAAAEADPGAIQARYLMGTYQAALNKREDAAKSFNEVLRLNPRAVAAQLRLAELSLVGGRRAAALELAESAAKSAPDAPQTQVMLVRALLAKGDLDRADRLAKALVAKHAALPVAHTLAGSVALVRGDQKAARRSYLRALQLEPANFEALNGVTVLDLKEGHAADARTRIDLLLAHTPADANLLTLSARTHAALGDDASAEALLKKAIEADSTSLYAYGLLGQIYMRQRKVPAARAAFEEIASKQPDAVSAHTVVALLYEVENNRAEARKRYERVMQIDPRAPVAANNLAWMYAEDGGNLDVALQLAQTAKARLPDVPQVNDTLGWIYYKKNLPSLAIAPLEQAAGKDPKNATYQYHLGLAYGQTGEKIKARRALELALRLGPNPQQADAVRTALKSL